MRRHSPFNYAFNNPIRFIDPDGRQGTDVIIKGNKSQEALQQLQASVQGQLELSIDDNGKVTAIQISEGKLPKGANDLLLATIDRGVSVNISATDNDFTSDMSAPLLGIFMGNEFTGGSSDFPIVSTKQEANIDALRNLDTINNASGQTTLHEVTESYIGGKLSQSTGKVAGKATPAVVADPNSIYNIAHNRVVPRSGLPDKITGHYYNSNGQEIYENSPNFNPANVVKVVYKMRGQEFHTVPKKNSLR